MKKILVSLLTISLLAMASCSKDEDEKKDVVDTSKNTSALSQKAFVVQQTYKDAATKTEDDDLVTLLVSFLDATHVRFEQALTDADGLLYFVESQTVSYSYADGVGKFSATIDGQTIMVSFGVVDGKLQLSYTDASGDVHSYSAGATDFVQNRQVSDNLANTFWSVNSELKSKVFSHGSYDLIMNSNIQFAFDSTGNTGKMIFYNSDLYESYGSMLAMIGAANGIDIDVIYTMDVMPYLNKNFGGISIHDASPMGSQAETMFTSLDYVMVDDSNMVLHIVVSDQIAAALGLSGVNEVFIPMKKTDGIIIPENGNGEQGGGTENIDIILVGSTYTLGQNAMASGYFSFTSETEGSMLISTSMSGDLTADFTYTHNNASVVITPIINSTNQMLSMILTNGQINATLSNGGNTLGFSITMGGNTIPVVAIRNAEE